MRVNKCRKYFFSGIMMLVFLLAGCGNNENNSIKESSTVSNSNTEVYYEGSNTNTDRNVLNSIYEKLSDSDKKMIVDLSKANIDKVVLENDEGIKKVNDSVDIVGSEIYKAEYKTNNETLGELIVYADIKELSILGYGLIE